MTKIDRRAYRIFAALEHFRDDSPNSLDSLLPFFLPILANRTGKLFDAQEIASSVRDSYRWNITADVVEWLSPKFVEKGWITVIHENSDHISYHINCENQSQTYETPPTHKILEEVIADFRNFVAEISPLFVFSIDDDQIGEIIVEWLISLDAFTEDDLRTKVTRIKIEEKIFFEEEEDNIGRISSEHRYLCARYVKKLIKENSIYTKWLCRLASIGLVAEIIQDFHTPVSKLKKSDIAIYLDAPVAMDLLGLSGIAARENILPILDSVRKIGGSIRIFSISVDEIRNSLRSLLGRRPADRTGPTAGALRRNEVLESYVRAIESNTRRYLEDAKVSVVNRSIELFPNEHRHFTLEHRSSLYGYVNWHLETLPREHDTDVVMYIMRMRTGRTSRDIFDSKHIMVTRNPYMGERSKRFCCDFNLLQSDDVGPVIHQRQLATAAWLRTGLSSEKEEIPKRYLLAACERVLELRKGMIERVRAEAKTLTEATAAQLELMLSDDRSVQVLLDRTAGSPNLLTSSNILEITEEMKSALIAEEKVKTQALLIEERTKQKERLKKIQQEKSATEAENEKLKDSLRAREYHDERVLLTVISKINNRLNIEEKAIRGSVYLLLLIISILGAATELLSGYAKFIPIIISSIVACLFAKLQIWDKKLEIEKKISERASRLLDNELRRLNLSNLYDCFSSRIRIQGKRIVLLDHDDTSETGVERTSLFE
jgi:hypothetical protein